MERWVEIMDWRERPFVSLDKMETYKALDAETARRYGHVVKAAEISNRDYGYRYREYSNEHQIMPPPSAGRIFLGWLVVRNLGTTKQYETWMSSDVFEELYAKQD